MLQTTTMPLSKGSLHSCTFKRIPDETRFHVVDPNVIQKGRIFWKNIFLHIKNLIQPI